MGEEERQKQQRQEGYFKRLRSWLHARNAAACDPLGKKVQTRIAATDGQKTSRIHHIGLVPAIPNLDIRATGWYFLFFFQHPQLQPTLLRVRSRSHSARVRAQEHACARVWLRSAHCLLTADCRRRLLLYARARVADKNRPSIEWFVARGSSEESACRSSYRQVGTLQGYANRQLKS